MQGIKVDFDSLVTKTTLSDDVDRRTFMKTALGSGFAAAVLPVSAQTMITTDKAGLLAGQITVEVKGQQIPVYRAQPEGGKDLPVILVLSEIFGVHEHIADVARRFARLGYMALAPELFVRQGDPAKYTSVPELLKEVITRVPDSQVMADLDACVDWAASNGGNVNQLGVTGFCWGGRMTWLYAAHQPRVKAGVAWYGRLVGEKSELFPAHPVDIAPRLKKPVLGLYGGKDAGIPLDTVERMKAELAKGHSDSQFVVFPDSGHAFHSDYRPSYVEADAREGWKRCIAWFEQHGVVARSSGT